MTRIPTHTLDSAPAATRPLLAALAERSPTPGAPINLHAQMAHAPAVLVGYMAMRKALDEHGTFDRKTRTALLLTVAAADQCAYTMAINTLIATQAGWSEAETRELRNGSVEDPRLASLLEVARQSAVNRGHVDEAAWQTAVNVGWTDEQLAEAFAYIGLTQYVDAFVNYARTDIDPVFATQSPEANATVDQDMALTVLLIVEDQDRTRAFYEQVLGASVARERDPVILKFHNSSIIANVGGPPTDDKPQVTLVPPLEPDVANSALNIRVADARGIYELWTSRGAHFLTPPVDHGSEIRCYLRDPDGHLIEVGQSVQTSSAA
jgi:catechol 2,3-dioxygenase-like lactoylglutathione lyase family enzyme/alkylhydroperoxidase/carboxymuconolactone decarboxylase family protein YurZ